MEEKDRRKGGKGTNKGEKKKHDYEGKKKGRGCGGYAVGGKAPLQSRSPLQPRVNLQHIEPEDQVKH